MPTKNRKSRPVSKDPPRHRLHRGDFVVASPRAFDGADPMTKLEVTAVHQDGTVDLKVAGSGPFTRINPAHLTSL